MVHIKWRTCYDKTLLHSIHTYNCGGNWNFCVGHLEKRKPKTREIVTLVF